MCRADGRTTGSKVKHVKRREFVIGGWLPGKGSPFRFAGFAPVGYYDGNSELRLAGRVGTGMGDELLAELFATLSASAGRLPVRRGRRCLDTPGRRLVNRNW